MKLPLNTVCMAISFTLSLATNTNAFGLPAQKPLADYAKTATNMPPFFGYGLINTNKSQNQNEVVGYVTGAPIDELFALVNDFSEESAYWKKTLKFNAPSFRSEEPNGVGTTRDFDFIENGSHYVEMLSFSDPENHALVYTLQSAETPLLNSLITYVTFEDEPENNRVKVTWRALVQANIPFFLIKKRQAKAYGLNIETLQTFY